MEAKVGGKAHHFYGPVVPDLKSVGKRTMEWDLNDWKWDGDLFTAAPLNSIPSDYRSRQLFPTGSEVQADTGGLSNSSSSCSDEINLRNEKGKRELEKRRRVVLIDDEDVCDEAGPLNLKLGGQVYPITEEEAERLEGKSGKKSKVGGATSNRAVCQVDDCRADLSNAKDYHRRHKVCDMHSKATKAMVGNVMQRFCQQCSRFHTLQEFDEGKRSCRRRLAGHNRRRRKTHPETAVSGVPLNDERSSSYLLISLLRILSNIHSNSTDQRNDQDLLSHLLKNLASLTGTSNERNLSGFLAGSQDLQNAGASFTTLEKEPQRPSKQSGNSPESEMIQMRTFTDSVRGGGQRNPCGSQPITFPTKDNISAKTNTLETAAGRTKLNNFDLNSVYDDSQDCMETFETFDAPVNLESVAVGCPLWLQRDPHKSSPPQTSGNSGSTATQSPSSSSGEAQGRTDRIVFKLFGKDPNAFPLVVRKQILDWLSHSPTDIEGYIRPGCIILSIYLRMENSSWEELCYDLNNSLRKLLDSSSDPFWRTGWVYARVLDHITFVCDGQIVLNTPLPLMSHRQSRILSVKPIAISVSDRAQFSVRGFNISRSTSRLICALEGRYLIQTSCSDVSEGADSSTQNEDVQTLSFSCSIPNVLGRGFIEIEDDSLSSSFFPFIVAEPDVCSDICTLDSVLDMAENADDLQRNAEKVEEARDRALDFINEIGWLLHRSRVKLRLANMDPNLDLFSFKRFRGIIEFSIEHDWCAVVRKLLGILFSGTVDTGEHTSIELALQDIGLLHRAVRRNCRPMVETLLNYFYPQSLADGSESKEKGNLKGGSVIFRPDALGPGGLTPLHVAAGMDGSESVLDALTDDPQLVGLEAWRSARDSTGLTPYDYASLRGHYTYTHLVQKKINKKSVSTGHVVLDIPNFNLVNTKLKLADNDGSKVAIFHMEKSVVMKPMESNCNRCAQKLAYGRGRASLAIYRPAMLSMVAIAAVCVCVALLFKSSPEVLYVFQPFSWERLKYGSS